MKIFLKNSENIAFLCEDDLSKAIPVDMQGKPLNFGQGEGQIEIEHTVWGFYVNETGGYYMVFEEGFVEWSKIERLVSEITRSLTQQFGHVISVTVEGSLHKDPNI